MTRALTNFNPVAEFEKFDRMMERFFGGPMLQPLPSNLMNSVPMDIYEKDNLLYIKAAVPGVLPEEMDVSIEDHVLTIKGETKNEHVTEDTKVYRREYNYGAFTRSVRLPEGLDLSKVEAKFDKGFVMITLPIVEEKKPKALKVPVKAK